MNEHDLIRSYQRIFRPQRRLYRVEGRQLPVPGGIPLGWLAWATGTLLAALVLSSRSVTVVLLAAAAAALGGLAAGGRRAALVAGALAAVSVAVLGVVLGLLDWPLRYVVLPGLVATLATQATPDGRRADRFAVSWVALRLAPRRRSLGRALPLTARRYRPGGRLWVASDAHSPDLHHAHVRGPARVRFAWPVAVRRRRWPWRRITVCRLHAHGRRRFVVVDALELEAGELAEVRP